MSRPLRYHPLLVALHWALAVLIVAALAIGAFWLAPTPNSDPGKLVVLEFHMAGGMLILALMIIRLLMLGLTSRPMPAKMGRPLPDRLAPIVHYGFYVLVVLMAATGLSTSILAGLNRSVFQRTGEALPSSFAAYPTFIAHSYLAAVLAAFIVLHLLAVLYHQFVRKDRLLKRMFFGRRPPEAISPSPRVAD